MKVKRKRVDASESSAFTEAGCYRLFKKKVEEQLERGDTAEFPVNVPPSGGEMAIIKRLFPAHEVGIGHGENGLSVFVERG